MKNSLLNWRTTVCGAIAGIGHAIQYLPGTLGIIGNILNVAGLTCLGIYAQDSITSPPSPIISSKQK